MSTSLEKDLRKILAKEAVSLKRRDLVQHSADALSTFRLFGKQERFGNLPQAVVWPESREQVSSVMSYLAPRGIPVVPWGGGTGVMGGASSQCGGVVIDLGYLNHIYSMEVGARSVVVGAGMVLQELTEELASCKLAFGHDPWSLPIATVGGAISTNGVGYLAAEYGSMGDQVLGLEVVLPSGEILESKGMSKMAGPNLDNLFVGAEGTLGIVTRAELSVHAIPEVRALYAFKFDSFEQGFCAVQEMYALGLHPTMIDFNEEFPYLEKDVSSRSEITLYLGFEGYKEHVEAGVRRGVKICCSYGGIDLGAGTALKFWEERHQPGERYKREVLQNPDRNLRDRSHSGVDYLHVCIPVSKVLEYRQFCQEILRTNAIQVKEWSVWGRPEFFSLLVIDPWVSDPGRLTVMANAVDEILKSAQDIGGSIEYCHGVGLKLSHLMERENKSKFNALTVVKRALDPMNIMNPGKLGFS